MTSVPFFDLEFAPAEVSVEPCSDGGMILRSPMPLGDYPPCLGHYLRRWASEKSDHVFLAERRSDGDDWRTTSYAETLQRVEMIAQALLDRDLGVDKPVMILSDNGIDHALLALAAMHVGIPVVPVSPAYSLMSQDHAKLKHIFGIASPGLVFAANGAAFEKALSALPLEGVLCVSSDGSLGLPFDDLVTEVGPKVAERFAQVAPATIAKILFTSGSTGMPKGVINTQGMLCSNQQMIAQLWPFLDSTPPILLDWLPWNHTFGGNHNFNLVLRNGGSLFIDGGKPAPGLIEKTVANIMDVSPTIYFNVPKGFDVLLPHLEADADLRDRFFKNLDLIFYAGAALPQSLWERLETLSIASRGKRVRLVSAWGATETAPMVTSVHFDIERAGVIGLPAPGVDLKFIPSGDKLEMRVRGPGVTPGYWKADALTQAAFDSDGYYCIGDAGKLVDETDPAKGVVFDGRTAEDFKLTTGTWVPVGALRVEAIAATAPAIQDVVVAGHDRDEICLLLFPNPAGAEQVGGADAVRAHISQGLSAYNADNPTSSKRIARAIMMDEPPSIDANEITDKGYINQRAVLERRKDFVERLYGDDPSADSDIIIVT